MLQYGITFRLNDLLMLSEAYSKLAKTDFNPKKVTYNEVYIKVDDIKNVDKICDTLKEEGYQISSMVDYRKQMQQQTAQRQLRLAGLAAISLFVAALNIANTMTMAIYERTREIGIRKAMGAKEKTILAQFVTEAATTSALGGTLGIVLGYIVSAIANQVLPMFTDGMDITVSPSFNSIAAAFGISVFIGVLFGYLPAKRAARLNPIDALRYD